MGVGTAILAAVKAVGTWAIKHPDAVIEAGKMAAQIKSEKNARTDEKIVNNEDNLKTVNEKFKCVNEHFEEVDEKLNMLGAAVVELNEKIDAENAVVSEKVLKLEQATAAENAFICKQLHTMKLALYGMGAALCATIILVVVLAIQRYHKKPLVELVVFIIIQATYSGCCGIHRASYWFPF